MHLTPSRVYTMELFLRIKCVTYFHEKASLLIFDWLLIAHQINELVSMTETSFIKELKKYRNPLLFSQKINHKCLTES